MPDKCNASVAGKTPVQELLRNIPIDHRIEIEKRDERGGLISICMIPIGLEAHEAADLIASQEKRIGELEKYIGPFRMLANQADKKLLENTAKENDTLKAMLRDVLPILERFAPIPHMKAKAMLSE